MITSGKHAHTIEAIWWPQNSCDWLRPAIIPFIHFQPVFFDKICKKGMGYLQKITHEWLQTWRPNCHSRLLRVQWARVRTPDIYRADWHAVQFLYTYMKYANK